MYSTLRIIFLAFAVLGLASLAGAWSCLDNSCQTHYPDCPDTNIDCGDCDSGVGTLDIVITTDPTCSSDGRPCKDDYCASSDTLSVRSTLYYSTCPHCTPGSRDIVVCQYWVDCNDIVVCGLCDDLSMTPSTPPDTLTLDPFECTPGEGIYQYWIWVQDIEDKNCACNVDPCESACAGNCQSGIAGELGCCLEL
ncbi:hypothetical protein ACFLU6_11010 [Acidobacteriota bacterium]